MVDTTRAIATAQRLITANGRAVTFLDQDGSPALDSKPWDGPSSAQADGSLAALQTLVTGHDSAIFDIQDITTLYSDDAKTTNATVGGNVRVIEDQSGNGYDAVYVAGAEATLEFDGERYYIRQTTGARYLSAFKGGTVVSFAHSFQPEDGNGDYRIYLDNLSAFLGWILETGGGALNTLIYSTGNGAGYDFDHPVDGDITAGVDTTVFGQIKTTDFILSQRGLVDAVSSAATYAPNTSSGLFINGYGATRWYRAALVDVELTAAERATISLWAASAADNVLTVDAVFVQPGLGESLGMSTTVSDLLKRAEQVMIVSPGAAVDLSAYEQVIDSDGSYWKIIGQELLRPGADRLLYFIGVAR